MAAAVVSYMIVVIQFKNNEAPIPQDKLMRNANRGVLVRTDKDAVDLN